MTTASTSLQPLFFGPSERRLFGIYYSPAEGSPRATGVLLCNAFGQEAIRGQRMMRVLAERLSRHGHPVFRFDYFGTGDSAGDDIEGDLEGWTLDVIEAHRQLRSLSAARRTTWIGMRLGATLALRAATHGPTGLTRLVLWDAVLDGARYLEHLRERHVATLDGAFSVPPRPSYVDQAARHPDRFRDEAIGFALSTVLREQLEGLHPDGMRWPPSPLSIFAIADSGTADGADLTRARATDPSRVTEIDLKHGTPWTADTAGNTSLVPAQALMKLVQLAEATA